MRRVLAELELCSHVPAAGYQPMGRSGKAEASIPTGDLGHERYRHAYNTAGTDQKRARVLEDAKAELAAMRKRSARAVAEETRADRDQRIVSEGEGFTTGEVARAFRCGERDVRTARKAHGRDPDTGKPLPGVPVGMDVLERRRQVNELREQGMSVRAIAMRLGVPRATVHRDLDREKAA